MAIKTITAGFYQPDIIIRSALIEAFRDIRANPWLFDFIFASLLQDRLTVKEYGEAQLNEARQYFLNNDVPIVWVHSADFSIPRIAIIPQGTSELNQTLADINSVPTELIDSSTIIAQPYPTVGPFSPAAYVVATGTVTLPADMTTAFVFPGQLLVDTQANKTYPILDVVDDQSFTIAAKTVANFTNAIIAPATNLYMARLESLEHQESFRLEAYVNGNPLISIYLHSILMFALNRYKQDLLEARGFERSTCTSGPTEFMRGADEKEIIYMRSVTLSGFTRNYWPKTVSPLIQGIVLATPDGKPGLSVDSNITSDGPQQVSQGWGTNDSDQ